MRRNVGASLVLCSWVCLSACEGMGAGGGEMSILNVEPRAGASAGEQRVRITGTSFRQDIGYAVYFGAQRAPQVTIMDDTTLLVSTPQSDPGQVDIVVTAENGPAFRIHDAFTFSEQGGNVMEQVGETRSQGSERF